MINLADIKDKYRGPCWLIGNGPSLNQFDWRQLKDHHFSTGRIAHLDGFPVDFYISTSSRMRFRDIVANDIYQAISQARSYAFVDANYYYSINHCRDKITSEDNLCLINCNHEGEVTYLDAQDTWYSRDPSWRVSKFASQMFVALQIAPFLGFNPLYLVGFDIDFKPFFPGKENNHFFPNYETHEYKYDIHIENFAQTKMHKIAYTNLQAMGIDVFNCTDGGSLEVYPRRDWRDLI